MLVWNVNSSKCFANCLGYYNRRLIGKLFVAGVIPGIILSLMFAFYNFSKAVINPKLAPEPDSIGDLTKLTSKQIISGLSILGLIVVVLEVFGEVYSLLPKLLEWVLYKFWYCFI